MVNAVTVQAGHFRHKSPPDAFTQVRVSSNCRVLFGRVCTVEFGDDWFLDFNIDGLHQGRERNRPVISHRRTQECIGGLHHLMRPIQSFLALCQNGGNSMSRLQ